MVLLLSLGLFLLDLSLLGIWFRSSIGIFFLLVGHLLTGFVAEEFLDTLGMSLRAAFGRPRLLAVTTGHLASLGGSIGIFFCKHFGIILLGINGVLPS